MSTSREASAIPRLSGPGVQIRRYPNRASIAVALLDHERVLQERLLRGPPPLGAGAPPAERLGAFYAAMVDLLERHGHLALGAEEGERRFATGAYGFWRAHVHALLAAAGTPASTRDAMVDVLLAPLAPEVYRYQRHGRGRTPGEITAALVQLAERVLGPPVMAPGHAG